MKKFLLASIIIVFSLLAFGMVSASAATYGDLTYTVANGEATITDCSPSASGEIIIPETLGGYPVTTIGDDAFYWCYRLTDITIPNSVTTIGEGAFSYCRSLTDITIPSSVTTIGDDAFYYCDSLTDITIPSSVTTIGDYAFSYCRSLTDITIPSSVTTIGDRAFHFCDSLTDITISNGVTTIGDWAFYSCESLTDITIPSSVTTIGDYAFSSCESLTKINVDSNNPNYSSDTNGVLFNKNKTELICYPAGKTNTSYSIPSSVTTIGDYVFGECRSLTDITIPNSVTTIGDYAFYYCYSLTDVYYNGTEEQWNAIAIGSDNGCLTDATRHYFTYYVTFFDQNGDEISNIKVLDDKVDIKDIPQREGYTSYVYTDKECINEFDFATAITEDTTLYVKYVPNQYTYKFTDQDGTVLKEETVDYGTVITPPEKPSKPATQQYTYIFCGWDEFTDGMTISGDITFTAQYTSTVNKYTYKFTDQDGIVLKEETVDYGTVITPPEVTGKDPYTLDYWQNYTDGMTVTADCTFTAVYKYKDYSITVDGQGDVLTITYGSNFVIEPQSKEAYEFMGYFTQKEGMGEQITDKDGNGLKAYDVVGDLTVYPYFKSIYLNKIEVLPAEQEVTNNKRTQRIIFATDKAAKYFVCTVKHSEDLVLMGISQKDFSVTEDFRETIDGYVYIYLTCTYKNSGDVPLNKSINPFDLMFNLSPNVKANDVLTVEILEDAILAGVDGKNYPFDSINNSIIKTDKVFAETITIEGVDEITTSTKYSAAVLPQYTTNKEVIWSVDDETIATVSSDGVVTPLKKGKIVLKATAKDGSNISAEKTINVTVYAAVAAVSQISTATGVWDKTFSPDVRDYTVYVPQSAMSIRVSALHNGSLKSSDGTKVFYNNVAKTIGLDSDKTVLELTYTCDGFADNTYTITIVKFDGTKTEVSEDKKTFTVTPIGIETGKTVILALYNGGNPVEVQNAVYAGETITFVTDKSYTEAKVMVWNTLNSLKPVCKAEFIK